MKRIDRSEKTEAAIFFAMWIFIYLIPGCMSRYTFSHQQVLATESRDTERKPLVELFFEHVRYDRRTDSLDISGLIQWAESQKDTAWIQFGIWKVEEEGAYFIIRSEWPVFSGHLFRVKTKIKSDEWLVIESPVETRFFNIQNLWIRE